MYCLDTDHLSEIIAQTAPGDTLKERLGRLNEDVATTIVSFEELLRGWLAAIHHEPKPQKQIPAYQRLFNVLDAFEDWDVFVWDEECVDIFDGLVAQRMRVKTMDLKIASIALRNDATLLSRNLKDFKRVPGLDVEDWLSSPTELGE